MQKSLLLLGNIVTSSNILKGSILIENGKIKEISEGFDKTIKDGVEIKDYRKDGLYLLPGLIEVHGHFREPGLEYKEDIPHGTKAALAGGYTTVFDMPNTKPPTTKVSLVEEKIKLYEGRSYTDFTINMGASIENINELEKIDSSKITGVKIFTAGHATTPTTIPNLGDIARVFEILGKRKIIALVHAENQELANFFLNKYKNELRRNDPKAWSQARNTSVVLTSALEMIALAKQFNVKLYLLHLSTPEEIAAVEFGRKIGVEVFGETVTYQLAFNTFDYEKCGNLVNVSPALRDRQDQEELWKLVREEKIDTICSEHTPHLLFEKEGDVWNVASGMPNIQESLPSLITGWVERFGNDSLEEGLIKISKLTSQNIAQIFGFSQKGGISVDKDADLTVISTKDIWEVKKEDLFTKAGWSAYVGKKLIGKPIATFLRGNLVYENGKIIGNPQGKFLEK